MTHIKTLILAWWNGTRLWPISRETSPKQFAILEELGGKSLFQLTLERTAQFSKLEDIYIVASQQNYFHALIQSEKIGLPISQDNIILQPLMKETLPIISLAARKIWSGNLLVLPSDQLIEDIESFSQAIELGTQVTHNSIVTFWIQPNKAETGYGYIEKKENKPLAPVQSFHEKPNEENAQKYIQQWFLWNAGIFLFDIDYYFEELKRIKPNFYTLINDIKKTDHEIFDKIEAISIDHGLLEQSNHISCVNLDLYWTDLGSFDAIGEYMDSKNINHKNLIQEGKVNNNIILSEQKNKEIAMIDVENLVVVDSDDVLLISKRGSTQKVKQITKKTKKINGNGEYRPWGSFKILGEWNGYKTKKIMVLPGKKLSLQSHNHRSEHWVVVSGTALVTIGEKESLVAKGESVFVPIGEKHRLENPGKIPLIVIESQIGDYLEEDDIIRYSDDFGRN